ncbi:hypothetical protein [Desulfoluna sp.]|uniref:hypothetical protein n=1 Tax=Desulfoluna sp. TaxID=2045199 RepID=UPI00260DAE73|nr:hypothetical protein [Desulfoluna sp.]
MDMDDIYQVNRLIYLGVAHSNGRKSLVSQHQREATELIQRFQAEESFQLMVIEGLKAMDLHLLEVEESGLRLAARHSGSLFAPTLTEYGKLLARNELKAAELLCVHCAIATAFFPTEADLDAPVEDLGVVMVEDVVEILRRFVCVEKDLPADDDIVHPQVRTAAQRFRELPEANPDSKRVGGGHSWVEMIIRVLDHIVETGYLLKFEEHEGEWEYRPTPTYQTAMKLATVYAFHAFRDVVSSYSDEPVAEEGEA